MSTAPPRSIASLRANGELDSRHDPRDRSGRVGSGTSHFPRVSAEPETSSRLRSLAEDLRERRARARLGGGEERIARQHEAGKLTARERIALLVDEGTFTELGIHAQPHFSQRAMEGREAAADGVITGYGRIDGRMACVCAYDFTVMAGAMGMTGELKVARLRELALTQRVPFLWLLDSAGARIQEAVGSLFAGSGHLFREEVVMSGVVPQVAALMGPCAAGTAYIPGLADFVPMVKGRGSMALAGPHLVRAAIGEDVTQEELGGSRVHCRRSGVGDIEVADDAECIARIKQYLSFFPSHCEERPPVLPVSDPADRMDDELLDVLPDTNRKPYDMYEVIRRIVDDGDWLDVKGAWARTVITCLARMGGRPVGIVANQPRQLGGILDNDSADKAARFVNLCNAFGIPLVFLQDVPGFMVGTKVEAAGIIRHGAKMLHAVAAATVPKITVVLRKAYGAGYYVMCGRAYEPDLIVAWPTAEISVMGAEGAVEIVFRKQVEEAEDPAAKKAELIGAYRDLIDVYVAARNDMIDDVIDPRETRPTIIRALELAEGKRVERPWKRHAVVPV
jgi:acetyl-CoA carboxylase carboxyltransferase component